MPAAPGKGVCFLVANAPRPVSAGESVDVGGEAGLVARGGVRVDDLLLGGGVDDAQGGRKEVRGSRRVTGVDGGTQALDRGAQARAVSPVAVACGGVLADALLGGLGVGHSLPLTKQSRTEVRREVYTSSQQRPSRPRRRIWAHLRRCARSTSLNVLQYASGSRPSRALDLGPSAPPRRRPGTPT